VGVGTGPADGYNDALLNQLTDYGHGAYVYIDSAAEAQKMFFERFSEVMEIGARDVAVSVSMPGYFTIQHYYGESIAPADHPPDPQHLAPGDAMVFNMKLGEIASGCFDPTHVMTVDVDWKTPFTEEPQTTAVTMTLEQMMKQDVAPMLKANAVIVYAEALKSLDAKRLEDAKAVVQQVYADTGSTDTDLEDIIKLIALHPALK
jgi:Ca-activated chloride channel homolog